MDLRLLEYFVAVAELEHVGKAAARLHISQSPLSRQIRQLEKDLQLQLFVREKQRIRLTESGRWLLQQVTELLAHSQKIRLEAEQRSRGTAGTLSVAFTSAAMWSGMLPRLLKSFQRQYPGATVQLHNMRSPVQASAIRSGRADLGFGSASAAAEDLEVTCISEEPFMLVVPGTSELSQKRRIEPQDLDGTRWVLQAEAASLEKQERFVAACAKAGFTPEVVQRVAEPMTLLALVEGGLGVGLIRTSARNYAPPSLTFRTLPWLSLQARTYMIRPVKGRQPLSDAFTANIPAIE